MALLAAVDAAHEDLSGPATRHILERECQVFGNPEYESLSEISISHIYNLRHSKIFRGYRVSVRHTQRSQVSIAERRKPDPQGKPDGPAGVRLIGPSRHRYSKYLSRTLRKAATLSAICC